MSDFPRRLKRVREAQGVSLYWLAHATGLSKQGVINLEAEDADPKLSTLLKLANSLGVSPHDLLPPRSGEGANLRDAVTLARHLLPTARQLEEEACKERVYLSGVALCDLANRIKVVLEGIEEAATLARQVLPELKALIKEARREAVYLAPDKLAALGTAVARLLQDAAREEESTPVDPPKEVGPKHPAGRRRQESTRVDDPREGRPEQPREVRPDAWKAKMDKSFERDKQKQFRYLRDIYPDLAPRAGEEEAAWARRMRGSDLSRRHPALPGMLAHLLRAFDPAGEPPPGPPPTREPDPGQVVPSTRPGSYSGPAVAEAFARDCEPYLRAALEMADKSRARSSNSAIFYEVDGVLKDVLPNHEGKSTIIDQQIAALRPLLEEVAEVFDRRHGKGKYTHPALSLDPRKAFLPTVCRMFEVLGLEPSRLPGDSPEAQEEMRKAHRRRAARVQKQEARKARR
jgi:transcriptional regulator with XRE-family HTH domain